MTATLTHRSTTIPPHSSAESQKAWLATLLRRLAARPDKQPRAGKAAVNVARDVAAVREYASRHLPTDPGFAADLFAAADRHLKTAEAGSAAAPATQRR